MQGNGQLDWPGIKTLAISFGSINAAATKMADGLPPEEAKRLIDRINKRGFRERWLDTAKTLALSAPTNAKPLSQPVQTASVALAKSLEGQKQKSRSLLAKFVVNASKVAARSRKPLADAQNVRHVAAVHSSLWPEEQKNAGMTLNLGIQLG